MKRQYLLCLSVMTTFMAIAGCGRSVVGPDPTKPDQPEYRVVSNSSGVEVWAHRSIPDSFSFSATVEDSTAIRTAPARIEASWQDGTRTGYGWGSDHDFYINFRTPRSCCYRVSYTYALYYALKAADKPLIVYATGTNADGSINWRIIIGASVLRYISPVSDWFLFWQAKMQYYG